MTLKNTQLAETLHSSIDAHAFSGVVSLRQGGEVLFEQAAGYADRSNKIANTVFDHFSVSRPWYELRGPRDYLAVFPAEPMKFPPGTQFSYSNGGYILLGVVIEELTGMKYQEYVEQAIFSAIGMNRSGFFAFNQLPEKTAFGYIEEADGWRTNIYNLPIVGASDGGAYTTVDDLATLWKAFWANEILPQALVELYATPYVQAETEGTSTYYGHGLWIDEAMAGQRAVYITGGDAGVSFKSSVLRASDRQITVISNTSNGAWPLLRAIERALER